VRVAQGAAIEGAVAPDHLGLAVAVQLDDIDVDLGRLDIEVEVELGNLDVDVGDRDRPHLEGRVAVLFVGLLCVAGTAQPLQRGLQVFDALERVVDRLVSRLGLGSCARVGRTGRNSTAAASAARRARGRRRCGVVASMIMVNLFFSW
jgi:hypothetical protein